MSNVEGVRGQHNPEESGISPLMTVYALGVLALVSFFNYSDRMILSVIAEPLKHELGLSDANLGLLSGLIWTAQGFIDTHRPLCA